MSRVPAAAPFAALASRAALAAILAACLACGGGDLGSPDPARRAAAVRAAGARGGADALATLLVAQRDGSAEVRRAAAEAFAARGGVEGAEALGALLADPDATVAAAAARGLAGMPDQPRARGALRVAYADASPAGRAAIADALDAVGVSLREAVEQEARTLWERNLAALGGRGPARAGAAEELGASGRAEVVARLVPLLDPARNADRALAAGAARGLGEAGDWGARPALEGLLRSPDPELIEAGAGGLGRLGDPGATAALEAVALASSGRIAAAAADALAALPEALEVGAALCEVAVRSADPAVAARAAREVRLREADCPARPFLARLGRPGAEAALAALGELGLTGAAAEAAAARLLPLLDPARGDPGLRAAAARALARLGAPGSAGPLRDRAAALSARRAAALGRPTPEPLPAGAGTAAARAGARPPTGDGDARELGALLAAAGGLRAPGAEPLLLEAVRDPHAAVRTGAVAGLAGLGTDAALRAVAAALDDGAPEVRLAAAAALGRAGPRSVPALARAAGQAAPDDGSWRSALAVALGDAGGASAVAPLTALLEGASAPAAAFALGKTGAPAAVKPLVDWLARPGSLADAEAIEALAQLAARDAGPAIAAQLTADRAEVRAVAARAIGRLRHEAAAPRLEALRSDYHGRVRRAAVEALSRLPAGAPRLRR
ncbi:PBS lyase HEAT domain protein repeat-containing protein [Anaeromyxobacter sp. K]|uniref:HEAT repeat domain-containing protein n=1 Tax=Anaeromyxobacter sp. (strain K) TaxID=447217 RepID=UPI00017BE199|nr:HEAT repeat domain-containing protein [Anaeromyxobacter sp. K]ACG73402.1 PBS lyase HEAT domain protein repeat-containing protein [Anaeromyxobacter sp. K]